VVDPWEFDGSAIVAGSELPDMKDWI